jgi:hypothetical protein
VPTLILRNAAADDPAQIRWSVLRHVAIATFSSTDDFRGDLVRRKARRQRGPLRLPPPVSVPPLIPTDIVKGVEDVAAVLEGVLPGNFEIAPAAEWPENPMKYRLKFARAEQWMRGKNC